MSPSLQPATPGLTIVPASSAPTDTPSLTPAKQPKERHLTITPRSLPRGRGYINVPQLILRGLYLEKMGFTIGSKVTVIQNPGEIIVRLDGDSAEHDPSETPKDRRQARKVKQVTEYQQSTHLPLKADVISQYLSGKMPLLMQELLYKLINGELSEPYQTNVYQFLHSTKKPVIKEKECAALLREINNLPERKRKRAARQTKSSGATIKVIQKNMTHPITSMEGNFIQPAAIPQVAEPAANPPISDYPPIDGLDPGRSYTCHVLQSLPPPSFFDPAASPTWRESVEHIDSSKPPEIYPEIPLRLRGYFTVDELELYDSCRDNCHPKITG